MFNWKEISMAGMIILAIIFYTYKKYGNFVKIELTGKKEYVKCERDSTATRTQFQ